MHPSRCHAPTVRHADRNAPLPPAPQCTPAAHTHARTYTRAHRRRPIRACLPQRSATAYGPGGRQRQPRGAVPRLSHWSAPCMGFAPPPCMPAALRRPPTPAPSCPQTHTVSPSPHALSQFGLVWVSFSHTNSERGGEAERGRTEPSARCRRAGVGRVPPVTTTGCTARLGTVRELGGRGLPL